MNFLFFISCLVAIIFCSAQAKYKEDFISFVKVEGLRLADHYKTVNLWSYWNYVFPRKTILNCWDECDKDTKCVAVTYRGDDCYLYDKNFSFGKDNEYISFFKIFDKIDQKNVTFDCFGFYSSWSPCSTNTSTQKRSKDIVLANYLKDQCSKIEEIQTCEPDTSNHTKGFFLIQKVFIIIYMKLNVNAQSES